MMAMRHMSVMTGFLLFIRIVVLGCRQMLFGSFLMMLRCLAMMVGDLLRHGMFPLFMD
jgi:hypothetical protein